MTYTNFMTNFTGAKLFADRPYASKNFGKASWDAAINAGYNPSQVKTALQQLGQHGYGIGSGLRTDRMQGVKGAAHGMSRFQGPGGNMGLNSYMQAKMAGYSADEIRSGAESQGMYLPQRASQQYMMDKQNENERDMMLDYMNQLTAMMNRPQPNNQVGRSTPYSVGTQGAAGISSESEGKSKKKRGTKKWNRDAWAAALNTAQGTGAASGSSGGKTAPVNVTSST